MSRSERIEFEGAYYHVMKGGRRRENIFHDDVYYQALIQTLEESGGLTF